MKYLILYAPAYINLETVLRICGPAMIAMMIFAVSPGRYGITPTPRAATKRIPSCPASHAVPKKDKSDQVAAGRSEKLADTATKSGEYRKSYCS